MSEAIEYVYRAPKRFGGDLAVIQRQMMQSVWIGAGIVLVAIAFAMMQFVSH